MQELTIRPATEADAPALSRICLLTADAGKSAEELHDMKELPGLVYAVPYVKLPTAWGFVLVDQTGGKDQVVGYILGSKDTRAYEKHAAETWWPRVADNYPVSAATKPADLYYTELLRNMHVACDASARWGGAHFHIDILEEYQKQGWGRKLIDTAVEYLKKEDVNPKGLWMKMDPRNTEARKFYLKIGFEQVEGADEHTLGIKWH